MASTETTRFSSGQACNAHQSTNIGLLDAEHAVRLDSGYVTGTGVEPYRSMETIAKLERYEGHLLNWYDVNLNLWTSLRFNRRQRKPARSLSSLEHGLRS